MVGNDLVVGNDGSAMREVLDPPRETSAGGRRVLSSDPRFLSLRDAQEVPSGSLLAYGDWQRLGRRLQSHLSGVPASLIRSSGLGAARSVMLVLAPADDAFAATLLLGFGSPGLDEDGPEERDLGGIDGWFAATKPVAARELLRELPTGGLGGMVLSVDLSAVAAHSPRSSHLVWDLRDAFHDFGLDFDRNVLERLAA
ncbi:MAG TPA: hypothetical protein ENI87_01590, partial [bacterium]|nr:hypothetical protein [bacterium]